MTRCVAAEPHCPMLVHLRKDRYLGRHPSVAAGITPPFMRQFLLALLCFFALASAAEAQAPTIEPITVPEDVNAVNLTRNVEIVPGVDGRVQLSTAAGADGVIRRIEVPASEPGTNPNWA